MLQALNKLTRHGISLGKTGETYPQYENNIDKKTKFSTNKGSGGG
jgi:hypothetical protein